MNILLVEDDAEQIAWLIATLESYFCSLNLTVFKTEHQFRSELDSLLRQNRPDIMLIDAMLPWTNPAPDMPPRPSEVQSHGFLYAGVRCQRLASAKAPDIPTIIYSILERKDLRDSLRDAPSNVKYVRKDDDARQLVQMINNMVH
jgi:CheY-like chemotaxis protein